MNLPSQFGMCQGSDEAIPTRKPLFISVTVTLWYAALQ